MKEINSLEFLAHFKLYLKNISKVFISETSNKIEKIQKNIPKAAALFQFIYLFLTDYLYNLAAVSGVYFLYLFDLKLI